MYTKMIGFRLPDREIALLAHVSSGIHNAPLPPRQKTKIEIGTVTNWQKAA